jgi:hypothetical protein
MLALAIEFSRCPRARTLKAEQRVGPDDPDVRDGGQGIGTKPVHRPGVCRFTEP